MAPRHTFTHAHDAPDLAAIVLAESEPRAGRIRGHDARSVALLLLVIASLAAVVVGAMSMGSGSGGSTAAPIDSTPSALASLESDPVKAAGATAARTMATPDRATATAAPAGIALGIGRITATPDRAQGALVVRVAVTNTGTDVLVAGSGAQLLVLIDDRVIGTASLGALAARQGRVVSAVSTYTCTPGRHVVTAIADATSRVRHASENNVARSAELTLSCPR